MIILAENIVVTVALIFQLAALWKIKKSDIDFSFESDDVQSRIAWESFFWFCSGINIKWLLVKFVALLIGG